MGLWFAVFPTVETLAAQLLAAALVVGSYFLAREQTLSTRATSTAQVAASRH
jgi:high-affinity iron transporter